MGWDPAANRPEIEEVGIGARAGGAGRPAGPSGGGGRRGAVARRWLPALALAGAAALIVGAGVFGPKAPAPDHSAPDRATASPPAANAEVPSPGETPAASPPPADAAPALRLAGPFPADRFLVLGGRWVDLATGTVGEETGCEHERPLVLAGGRIVCVTQTVTRSRGSLRATYDLAIVDLGSARAEPAQPWSGPPALPAEPTRPPAPLRTLVGWRDLVIGDPVAIAVAPGAEPDSLLLAWAVLDRDGYRVGLDRYRIGDGAAAEAGSREVFALPLEDGRGPTSLADLGVSVSPDGRAALVGITVAGTSATPGVRRLAVLRMDDDAANGAAIGPPAALPAAVAANSGGPATVVRDEGTACGGALGEGWATDDTLFLVCPGRPSVFRRVTVRAGSGGVPDRGAPDGGAPAIPAAILDEVAFTPEDGADALSLAGNGVAIDRGRGRYYRWSPRVGVAWAIDLDAAAGSQRTAASIGVGVDGPTGIGSIAPTDDDRGARPVLALDAARDVLYLVAPDAAGRGARIAVVEGEGLQPLGSWTTAVEPYAALALSPDGRLLYLAAPPRRIREAAAPVAAVAVLDTDPLTERLFAGRLPAGAWDPAEPLVIR